MKLNLRLAFLPAFLLLWLQPWTGGGEAMAAAEPAAAVLYVSPTGSRDAEGSREKPLATLAQALTKVSSDLPATIYLLGGIYREQVTIPRTPAGSGKPARLVIASAPGEEAVFEGGEPILKWEPSPLQPGLYVIAPPRPETVFAYEWLYYDIWESGSRVRYRKQNDAEGVKAYPGSVCVLDDKRLLIHTRDGRTPGELGLWRNRLASALRIGRGNLRLEGITFRNFVGGTNARALTLTATVEVDHCKFFNCVRGISNSGNDVRISHCEMREVGLGVLNTKDNTTLENCLFESASGAFAFSELNEHLHDGIRFYYPARGGTVRGCLTVGFWGGLYIKTNSSAPDALPFLIENNTFLDGITSGSGPGSPPPFAGISGQPKSTYVANLIGPNEHANDAMVRLPGIGATVAENYFFSDPERPQAVNRRDTANTAGADPFVDLAAGNLAIKDSAVLPKTSRPRIGANLTEITWQPHTAAALTPRKKQPASFDFLAAPTVASSREGAVVTATLAHAAPVVFKYRKLGARRWIVIHGAESKSTPLDGTLTSAPVETQAGNSAARYLFNLTGGKLAAEEAYEFTVEVAGGDRNVLHSAKGSFHTSGGPKTIFVKAGATADRGRGTEQEPFHQLQPAFDNALPGDTIRLEPGVYTEPFLLTHGGTAGKPVTLKGSGKRTTILDGGKERPILMELTGVSHVSVSDVTVRWFGVAGLAATDCSGISVLRSHFQNGVIPSGEGTGWGIFFLKTPHSTISHCTFTTLENGIVVRDSPFLTVTHNTAFRNTYAGASLVESSAHSTIAYNSLTFTGNDSLVIRENDRNALEIATCDFNNYGTFLRKDAKARPENDVALPARYGRAESKAIIRGDIGTKAGVVNRFFTLGDWRNFSKKDSHAIFADPLYADPLKGDFRLLPGSPNLLPDGKIIGAEPPAPQPAS